MKTFFRMSRLAVLVVVLLTAGCHSADSSSGSAGPSVDAPSLAKADEDIARIQADTSLPAAAKAQRIAQIEAWKKQQKQSK